ncbi:LacI family DNA-binding transcriptional regulator [Brachybacterium endophyticum]|uniref:LacI family DNA-binding transcriptional regulator n=1 Tax=Brachybacterium endophyticum TaxID=2182385 RepID=UPI001F0C3CF4|nr:LacI family DNA-binding transcriptional regulator [Brachybacterium endophyticum]
MTSRGGAGRTSDGVDRRATIVDVAERAGVSRQTVTRAMNDMPGISSATRERVLAAADELNYRPSRFGRGLVSQGPPTLGLLVNDLGNAFFPEIAVAVIREATTRGWNVVVSESDGGGDPATVAGELMRRADALLGYSLPEAADEAVPARMPLVRLDLPEGGSGAAGVRFDDSAALTALADHLGRQGCQDVVVLDTARGEPSGRAQRLRTAIGAVVERARVEPLADGGPTVQLDAALAGGADALVAWNDVGALQVLKQLRARGVRVPEDVRVAGVDGLALGALVSPELTTIGVDQATVAREAVDVVDGLYTGRLSAGEERAVRTVPYRLIVRESA